MEITACYKITLSHLHFLLRSTKHFSNLNVWSLMCAGDAALCVETPGWHLEGGISDTLLFL